MDAMKTCSGCQEPLVPNAPDGLCPECLIDDSHYVVVGVMKPQAFSAGGGGLLAAQDFAHDV
jgi:hypothetical protein